MKDKLIAIYNELMKVSVKGMDIESMYKSLSSLAEIINNLPEEEENEDA